MSQEHRSVPDEQGENPVIPLRTQNDGLPADNTYVVRGSIWDAFLRDDEKPGPRLHREEPGE